MPQQPNAKKERSRDRKQRDIAERALQLQGAIDTVNKQIQSTQAEGWVAPPGCWVDRYAAKSGWYKRLYYYYKLQANDAIFPSAKDPNKLTKYKHLGKIGSTSHIEAVFAVERREKIQRLQMIVQELQEALHKLQIELQKMPEAEDVENLSQEPGEFDAVIGGDQADFLAWAQRVSCKGSSQV